MNSVIVRLGDLRDAASSVWTAVALHWLVVLVWQGGFGGPSFAAAY